MSKKPVPGEAKTRLAAGIGAEAAALLSDAFLRDTVETGLGVGGTDLCLCYTPRSARGYFEGVTGSAWLVAQPEGDLGRRLSHAFAAAFQAGYEAAVVIGSDAPQVAKERIEEAFSALGDGGVVIGPSDDGGYYLLGLTAPAPSLFTGIDWSTERVFAQTLGRAADAGLRVAVLNSEFDIDTVEDLYRLEALLQTEREDCCRNTRAQLAALTEKAATR